MSRSDSGTYSRGTRLFELGHKALRDQRPASVARPHLEALREAFGETAVLAERDGHRLIVIAAAAGVHGVAKGARVGEPDQWHSTSLGKAILAALPEDEAREVLLSHDLVRFTSRTLVDVTDILGSLRRVRAEGIAIDDEESEIGLRCIGSVVHDAFGRPRFAISVSGPAYRITLDAITPIAEAIKAAAGQISHDLGCEPPAHAPGSTAQART